MWRKMKKAALCALVMVAGMGTRAWGAQTVFSDNFESYNPGVLDKNQPGANPAPNGSGQPWWGPGAANMTIVSGPQGGVSPHSGTQMMRGLTPGNTSLEWNNVGYRENGGQAFSGNLVYDFWFYDPNGASNGGSYEDLSSLAYYSDAPTTTDYPTTSGAPGTLSNSVKIERLSLGAASYKVNTAGYPQKYDSTEYQARVVLASGGYDSNGWFNLPLTRSVGWHHGEIVVGPADPSNQSNVVSFYIDDLTTPLLTETTVIDMGYNTVEFLSAGSTTGYFDDATLTVVPEPMVGVGLGVMGLLLRRRRATRAY